MKKSYLILALSVIIIMSSCNVFNHRINKEYVYYDHKDIKIGMSYNDFNDKTELNSKGKFVKSNKYFSKDFFKKNGLQNYSLVSNEHRYDRFNYHYYLFENDKLVYWGFPHTFLSHKNEDYRKIAELVGKEY